MLESSVENRLKIEVEKAGGWCLKLHATSISGLPDRICLFPGGHIVFVELKQFGKKPRKIQLFMHEKLRRLGFRVEVIDLSSQCVLLAKEYAKDSK